MIQNFYKIKNENCFVTMKNMLNNSVDLILTSPPYNMTSRKGGYGDRGRYDVYQDWKSEKEYLNFTSNLFKEYERILNKDRVVLYNFSYSIENPSLPYKLVCEIENTTDWRLVDTIIWKKSCGLPFPANKRRLSRNWEFVWVFARKDEINTFEINRSIKSINEKGQNYYDVVYNFIEAKNNDKKTPMMNEATYSTDFCLKLLNIYAKDGYLVYDSFMGTGTTLNACKESKLKLDCIGSELSKCQCEYAENRIKNGKGVRSEDLNKETMFDL